MKKTPYTIVLITFCCFLDFMTNAQNLGEKIINNSKNTLERRTENAADRTLNKGVDKVEEGASKTVKGENKKKDKSKNNKSEKTVSNTTNETITTESATNTGSSNPVNPSSSSVGASLSVYSKFDFISGDKVILMEDFTQDAIGDFPAKWNTNASGEVVTLNNNTTRFLKTNSEGIFYPEWANNLPENFTLEFDLYTTDQYSYYSGFFVVGFTSEKNVGNNFNRFNKYGDGKIEKGGGFEIGIHPQNAGCSGGMTTVSNSLNNQEILRNDAQQDQLTVCKNKKNSVHVSIWRQKGRVRVYFDEKKVWDLPKLCPDGITINSIYFRNEGCKPETEAFFLSNIRVAIGAPDTRSKLITEGKFSTTGIKFDTGSDKIKPESYGVLKEIANVLNENPDVKIKIIGHTDSDGTPDKNLELSKKRASAVKTALNKEFSIDASRMETDGKGQTEPADSNATPQGKANNRRVEFIKL